MSNNVTEPVDLASFNEQNVSQIRALTQISANYGLLQDVLSVTDTAGSGSNVAEDSLFKSSTGASSDGFATISTQRQLLTRAGQGGLARFSAIFDTGTANNQQFAGLINAENSLGFGYSGTNFGIFYVFDGEVENQELTFTSPAAGAEVATVTIDGTGYPVNLTGGGTVQDDAYETAEQLNGTVPNYVITSNNNQVVATSVEAEPQGAFNFSSATAVASWTQINAGVNATIDFIDQADFNEDTLDDLNPQTGNEYQIRYQADFGRVKFYVQDPESDTYLLAHVITNANNNTSPLVSNPTFRVGWFVRNTGNTTDVQVQGARASAFIEGQINTTSNSASVNSLIGGVGTALTNILSIRNRSYFNQRINRAEILPGLLTLGTDTVNLALVQIYSDPTFADTVTWQYVDKQNSVIEFATDAVTITGGNLVFSQTFSSTERAEVDFNEGAGDIDIVLLPNQEIAIGVLINSLPVSAFICSLNLQQEF